MNMINSAAALRSVTIDGSRANKLKNMLYKGNGMVSGNNTSRLLMDYKALCQKAYSELLEYLFGESGLAICHLKLEMGADINSSSGTEPAVMRYENEQPDITRGAAFMLAYDAKQINPALSLDMLWWSEPKWVSDSQDLYAARYKWYKRTLDAAYERYGLVFDYVSATQNERAYDSEWIKYLSKALKSEKNCPYDYSQIKIVAGDEVCTWNIADDMLGDDELMQAIDAVGSHYTSRSTDNAKKLAFDYGKELWLSEGCPPMEYSKGTYRYDGINSGLCGMNGLLDIANRFLTMYSGGGMTLYEYQPAAAAYYSGAQYTQKQLIRADEPWSGYYELDAGFFMALHFSRFFKKGWAFIDGACFGDGKAGGDGHAIVDAVYTYMTAADPETGNYSVCITNTTDKPVIYELAVENLAKANSEVFVWETRGSDGGSYDENYFKNIGTVTPAEKGGRYVYSITVRPRSLVTVSTLKTERGDYTPKRRSEVMPLPYNDDFDYDETFLTDRGGAPLYTTDQGGAFEVTAREGKRLLMQKITPDIKANEWGGTPYPTTNLGDDRWYNYSVSADVYLEGSDEPEKNYAGIGLRYNVGAYGESGYRLVLFENGGWELLFGRASLAKGSLSGFSRTKNTLKIAALYNNIKAYINGTQIADITAADGEPSGAAGRAALYSYYRRNCFGSLKIAPVGDEPYVTRYDDTDSLLSYEGSWEHCCMSSFKNYKRTLSTGTQGAKMKFSFFGTGFALIGDNSKGEGGFAVSVDGGRERCFAVPKTGSRESICLVKGLERGSHTVIITVISGSLSADAVEILDTLSPKPKLHN